MEQFNPLKLKDFILENKDEILLKTSEMPNLVYEVLDELRGYSKNKNSSSMKINALKEQLSKEKFIVRIIAIGVVVILAMQIF